MAEECLLGFRQITATAGSGSVDVFTIQFFQLPSQKQDAFDDLGRKKTDLGFGYSHNL